MFDLIISTLTQGFIYALLSYGIYITYKILDFPDLTVDGSFPLGAAITAVLLVKGMNPFLVLVAALLVGAAAGLVTGVIHVKFGVRDLLAGIITMTALFSINLQIAGSNLAVERAIGTIYTSGPIMAVMGNSTLMMRKFVVSLLVAVIFKFILDWYLKTKSGMLLRAVGDNSTLVTTLAKDKGIVKIIGLTVANALVAFSGALVCMEQRAFSSTMGTGQMVFVTSCCPGWLRFVKTQFPEMVSQLSTAKSPQQMFGAVMKTYFAQSIGVDPENIVTVSVMPCVAKKAEADMDFYYKEYAGKDVDIVLTTREFTRMLRETHIRPEVLTDRKPDSLMQEWTGAGVIFGATGGVMEAALRTAYHALSGKNPDPDFFDDIRTVNEDYALTEANLDFNGTTVRTAIVSGLGNTRKLLEAIRRGDVSYDFVEVMACPGGCVGGGGQPICDGKELAGVRGENLHFLDKNSKIRFSHENQDVAKLYQDFLEHPLSHKSHMILHTDHNAWSMHEEP